jgi:hypothetical protein
LPIEENKEIDDDFSLSQIEQASSDGSDLDNEGSTMRTIHDQNTASAEQDDAKDSVYSTSSDEDNHPFDIAAEIERQQRKT